MKQFKDAEGRDWNIVVNVGTAKKIRDILSIDLFNLFSSEEAIKVFSDPILLVDMLYLLVQDQCKKRDVTAEQFGEGLVGDAIENASQAMMEEVANFFPSGRRQIAMKTIEKSRTAAKILEAKAMKVIEELDLESINYNPATK